MSISKRRLTALLATLATTVTLSLPAGSAFGATTAHTATTARTAPAGVTAPPTTHSTTHSAGLEPAGHHERQLGLLPRRRRRRPAARLVGGPVLERQRVGGRAEPERLPGRGQHIQRGVLRPGDHHQATGLAAERPGLGGRHPVGRAEHPKQRRATPLSQGANTAKIYT